MKAIRLFMMLVLFSCVFGTIDALAGNVYGNSAVIYDYANNRTRGYSRTQVDYETAEYYTPYVCGELYKDGVYQVRACQSGTITAAIYTQYTGTSSTGSVLSDHYVDMKYFEDEQSSYVDYSGYRFLPGSSYPGDWFFYPADIFGYFNPVSIHLGSTTAYKPKVKIGNMVWFESSGELFLSGVNHVVVKVDITASYACDGDPNCLHTGDQAQLELLKETAGGDFSYVPAPPVVQLVTLDLGNTKTATFEITLTGLTGLLAPYPKSLIFTIHITDIKRGGESFTGIVQYEPPNQSVGTGTPLKVSP
jgi:hypothetical protein